MFSASRRLFKAPVRFTSTAQKTASTSSFKPKSLKEAWLMDSGAYPVMGVIVFAVVLSTGAGVYIGFTHPDARVSKESRKSLFRGELKGVN